MANNDDPLFREVEEELRREQIARLWDKYGMYAVIGAIAVVLAVGGFKVYQARTLEAAQAAGAKYEAAVRLIDEGKPDEAQKTLETLAQGSAGGYAALSKLQLAGIAAKAGRKAEALTLYESVSASASDSLLRDLAKLQAAALRLGEADFTEMKNRLNDLATEGNPWRASARELLAVAALTSGQTEAARTTLEQLLADGATPASIAERARNMMAALIATDRAKTASSATPEASKN